MNRRTELRPGDVISFRVPQNISSDDLDYLNQVAGTNTGGKAGPVAGFFFRRLEQARVENSAHVSVTLPELSENQLGQLDDPIFQRALAMYACQLLGRSYGQYHRGTKLEQYRQNGGGAPPTPSGDSMESKPDPQAMDLLRKLQV